MLQRIVPFAIPTSWSPRAWRKGSKIGVACLALMGAAWLVPPAPVQAQTTVNYNFEDGVMRGTPTPMKVPPKILTESGNKFMRITGSTGDCHAIPSNLCPQRNRSTVWFTSPYSSMPLLSSANMRQTYSAKVRFHDTSGKGGTILSLFQDAPNNGGYGTRDGQGAAITMWRNNGSDQVAGRANYANETKWNNFDFGTVRPGQWHTIKIVAVWSHDPKVGRIEVYFDGQRKLLVTGRDSNLGPTSNRLPALKLGLYGDYATGIIDVDNVQAGPSSSASPAPSVALSAPTNVQVVSGQ
jgi:hypothetical protein